MSLRFLIPIAAVAALAIGGCDAFSPDRTDMQAQLNGEPWEAEASAYVHADTAFHIGGSVVESCPGSSPCNGLFFVIDSFARGGHLSGAGTYPVRHATYYVQGGDVVYGAFDVLNGTSIFSVTSYDASSRTLRGEFEGVFVLDDYLGPGLTLPDTLRFTEGTFEVQVSPPWER